MNLLPGPVADRAASTAGDIMPGRAEYQIAATLLGSPPESMLAVVAHGRNRIFRVRTPKGDYALKLYGPADGSAPERFRREVRALQFLATGAMASSVPRVFATDGAQPAALLEWITGERPVHRRGGEVVQVQRGLQALLSMSRGAAAAEFPPAPSACLRPSELAQQMETRRDQLNRHDAPTEATRLLNQFDTIWPMLRTALLAPQDPARLVLATSEFGFHKALRRIDGGLVFLAFADFGWDDPARLVAELLWHNQMTLSAEEVGCIRNTGHAVFGAYDGGYARRFARVFPVYGLRWALTCLEQALSGRLTWQHRDDVSLAALRKQRALHQAGDYLERVRACLHDAAA